MDAPVCDEIACDYGRLVAGAGNLWRWMLSTVIELVANMVYNRRKEKNRRRVLSITISCACTPTWSDRRRRSEDVGDLGRCYDIGEWAST